MNIQGYKRHTVQAKTGAKGEAFFELLLSDHALPHRIASPRDIGIDYICEWTHGDKPTGILFAVQVKTFAEKTANPKRVDIDAKLNGLEKYEIRNKNQLRIDVETQSYWKGLGIPVYLFAVVIRNARREMDCYYRRYTPSLTTSSSDPFGEYHEGFYKANEGVSFHAFKDARTKTQGFARDLFIDHVRCCYAKGLLAYPDPRAMGLNQFQADGVFKDLFKEYEALIREAFARTGKYLNALGGAN